MEEEIAEYDTTIPYDGNIGSEDEDDSHFVAATAVGEWLLAQHIEWF